MDEYNYLRDAEFIESKKGMHQECIIDTHEKMQKFLDKDVEALGENFGNLDLDKKTTTEKGKHQEKWYGSETLLPSEPYDFLKKWTEEKD